MIEPRAHLLELSPTSFNSLLGPLESIQGSEIADFGTVELALGQCLRIDERAFGSDRFAQEGFCL